MDYKHGQWGHAYGASAIASSMTPSAYVPNIIIMITESGACCSWELWLLGSGQQILCESPQVCCIHKVCVYVSLVPSLPDLFNPNPLFSCNVEKIRGAWGRVKFVLLRIAR